MGRRINVRALCAAICLLAFASLAPLPVASQVCEDCELIKQRQVEATRLAAATTPTQSATAAPVVRLVLYWAEGCGHCLEVLDGILPQLEQAYGPQLEVRLVEVVSLEDISAFFDLAEAHGYLRGRASVPFLLIADRALMGVEQIEAELPGLVAAALAAGGSDWPAPPTHDSAGQAGAAADDACGFAAPCEEEAATAAQSDSPRLHSPLVLATASILGLGLIVSGAIGICRRRGATQRRN